MQLPTSMSNEQPSALMLFNGSIDSVAAAHMLNTMGQRVVLLNFKSPFYGGQSERLKETARALKAPLIIVDIS